MVSSPRICPQHSNHPRWGNALPRVRERSRAQAPPALSPTQERAQAAFNPRNRRYYAKREALLCQTFHEVRAEGPVFVADGLRGLLRRRIPPRLRLVETVELNHDDARRRRGALCSHGFAATHQELSVLILE